MYLSRSLRPFIAFAAALLMTFMPVLQAAAAAPAYDVHAAKITILSTMLADNDELGEWGFSALVEVDGHKFLYDTGTNPDLVLKNAKTLGITIRITPAA